MNELTIEINIASKSANNSCVRSLSSDINKYVFNIARIHDRFIESQSIYIYSKFKIQIQKYLFIYDRVMGYNTYENMKFASPQNNQSCI